MLVTPPRSKGIPGPPTWAPPRCPQTRSCRAPSRAAAAASPCLHDRAVAKHTSMRTCRTLAAQQARGTAGCESLPVSHHSGLGSTATPLTRVARQAVKVGAVERGKGLKVLQRARLLKGRGVERQRHRRAEQPRAAAGRLLGVLGVGGCRGVRGPSQALLLDGDRGGSDATGQQRRAALLACALLTFALRRRPRAPPSPESVPRKNLLLPLVAAPATACRCSSRFRMGRQKAWGRRPPTKSALRLSSMCCGVTVAATVGGAAATNSAASRVVMCSMTTRSSGT